MPNEMPPIPEFLRRTGGKLTDAQIAALNRGPDWRAPAPVTAPASTPIPPKETIMAKLPGLIVNRDAPVKAYNRDMKTKDFANLAAFEAWYVPKFHGVASLNAQAGFTDVLLETLEDAPGQGKAAEKGHVRKETAAPTPSGPKPVKGVVGPPSPGGSRSKVDLIAGLLLREGGCTSEDVKTACGWPSVSMPQQAALAGLDLRKEKVGKVTRYYGTRKQ